MVSIPRNTNSRSLETIGGDCEGPIAPGSVIKHPLQEKWTLWYLENDRTKSWEDMQNKVTSFDTVEDFWSLYNHIVQPSVLGEGNDYSLFKRNIQPMWEDEANKYGGRWILNFSKNQRRKEVDDMWLDTLLYLIGATSNYSSEINGAVVNVRPRGDKISVWTADCQNKSAIYGIGMELKKYLGLEAKITYEMHNTTSKSSKSLCVI